MNEEIFDKYRTSITCAYFAFRGKIDAIIRLRDSPADKHKPHRERYQSEINELKKEAEPFKNILNKLNENRRLLNNA